MDYSPPLVPSKVNCYKRRNQILDQAEENEQDKTNEECVTVGTGSDEGTESSFRVRHPAVGRLCTQRELEGSSNMSSEDVIMDKLFQACDPQSKGKVKVSDLVEYLTTIVDMQLQEGRAVASLLAIMDPKNINAEIGVEAFHSGFRLWIEQIKSGHFMDMNMLPSREDSATFDVSQSDGLESSLDESAAEDKLSVSQLSSRVTNLQYLNRKVSEEIKESRAIIDSKEEELSKLSRDLQKAKSEIKRLSELADLRHETEAENEELREQMSTLNKKLDAERHRTHQTEQEKELLKVQLQRYKAQVDKLTSELDSFRHQQGDLKSILAKNKEKISHLKVTCCNFDSQLAEKDDHIQQLQTCLKELTKMNEDLKNQTEELRDQLIDTQQELLSIKSGLNKTSSGVKLPSIREMANEIEEDIDHPVVVINDELPSSIHNELQNLFNDHPNLPWPLSEKELKESGVTTPDLVSQVGHAINMSCQSIHEEAGDKSDPQRMSPADAGDSPQMKKKCTCDYHYDVSNEKLRIFVSLLKHFKDENQKLRRLIEQTCLNRKDFPETPGNAFKDSTQSGSKEVSLIKCAMVNEELSGPRRCQAELESMVKWLQNDNKKLLLEMNNLTRSNVELSEGLYKSELRVSELDEEFQNTQSCLNNEKQRCAELEESMVNSTLARQLDLHDIWRLVQKDVEIECEDFQEDCSNDNTSDQLKEKIKTEIEALKTRLQKREETYGSLKNNNLNLHLTLNYDELYQMHSGCNGRKWAPSSPLVDALTIDVFNGNLPMYNTNYPYPPPFVSCEDVDCYECRAARLFIHSRYASSCPSIVPTNINSSWSQSQESKSEREHQIKTKDKHLEGRARSLEVATDAHFCGTSTPKRKRSLYGSYRRQDFIKSSGRGVKEITQHRSLQNQQLETRTPTHKDKQFHLDSNIESLHHQAISNKDALNFVSYTNTLNSSSHDLTTGYNLHVPDDLEPALGVRRSSFKLAVECNHLHSPISSSTPQTFHSNKDNYSSIEELRRPSFHAAIERGKGNFSASNSFTRRKVVQIASPEISESRGTILQDYRQRFDSNENISNSGLSEGITFYFDESEPDIFGGAYTGAVWATPGYRGSVEPSTLFNSSTSLSSSAMVSSSVHSSTSSYTIPEGLGKSLSLGARHSQEKEDADINRRGKELIQDRADVSTSACVYTRGGTSAGMSQHTLGLKDGVSDQRVGDGLGHPTPDRHNETQESNPSIVRQSSDPSSSRTQGLAAASSTTASLHSSSPLTSSSLPAAASSSSPQAPLSSRVPARSQTAAESLPPQHVATECSPAGIKKGAAGPRNSDTAVSQVKTCSKKPVAPANSPAPGSRCPVSVAGPAQPVAQSQLSKIRESHLASKKREQMKARSMKLPELAEHSELETKPKPSAPTMTSTLLPVNTAMEMPQISVTDEDAEVPPAPSIEIVTPSLPDSFLRKLGLSVANSSGDAGSVLSIDQLSEKDLEGKFISLSLAFNTDKLTLSQRVSIQERSRDLAEQNVDVELQGLRNTMEALNELVTDAQLRALLLKIKLHINVLEQLAARVSSRAEMFGAVQQERRLCRAMEVMVMYTENLRRIREKEESELNEARKVLSEKSGNCISLDPDSSRRSLSVTGYNTVGRMSSTKPQQPHFIRNTMNDAGDCTDNTSMRRRSEIALPRIIGGIGSPSMTPTAALESLPPFLGQANDNAIPEESQEGEDPKSRFQSAVASTSMQNVVAATMRRCSLEKLASASSSSPASSFGNTTPSTLSVNKEPSPGRGEKGELRISKDEEAFRKGFAEGLKSKLSHELDELRDQQNTISQSLEHMMDKVDQSQQEDEEYFCRPSRLEATLSLASTVGRHMLQSDWRSNKKIFRYLAGAFFVFLAIFVVFFCPPISTVDVRHVNKPPQ